MQRLFAIGVLLRPSCGGRMKVIAEISDKRVARKMLEHVGLSSDVPEQWPARGPPESAAWFRSLDDEQRSSDDDNNPAPNVE